MQLDGLEAALPIYKKRKRKMACMHDFLPELVGYINVDDLKVTDVMLWVVLLP